MPQEISRIARFFAALTGCALLAGCGGGGGSNTGGNISDGNGGNSPGPGQMVTISGRITFDRLPFSTTPNGGLNPNAPVRLPAREVVVQAVANGGATVSTTTNGNGEYSLSVPANTMLFIRARAQMKSDTAPTWSFTVKDNTRSDAVYTLDGDSSTSGTANQTRDLHAPSGWTGSSYTGTRAAAPFAILDTVYSAKEMIRSAAPAAAFPPLDLFWAATNKPAAPRCPDDGAIVTTSYVSGEGNDGCSTPTPLPPGIYLLGDVTGGGDTDEFDEHVIAHEFGHYFEDKFSRSDSFGGEHGIGERIDLRLAFSEGWGNAFSAMSLNDPVYRDSSGAGLDEDFSFNLESDSGTNEGWFSETSVGEFLWDVFDSASLTEPGDGVALSFTPIYTVMTNDQKTTAAATSIFSFASALRTRNPGESSAIGSLLSGENIHGTGAFGDSETNNGGGVPQVLPVYLPVGIGPGNQAYACVSRQAGFQDKDKLGNRRLLSFVNDSARTVQIRVQGASNNVAHVAATDPDIFVFSRGVPIVSGTTAGSNVETVSPTLDAGTFIIEVYDDDLSASVPTDPRCMYVTITAAS